MKWMLWDKKKKEYQNKYMGKYRIRKKFLLFPFVIRVLEYKFSKMREKF